FFISFFFKHKTAYEIFTLLEFRRVLFRSTPEVEIELHTSYHFGGYAKTKPELIDFIKDFCKETGIMIEPVYTGKLFYAVVDLIRSEERRVGKVCRSQWWVYYE